MAQIHVLGLNAGKFENLGGSNDSGGLIAQPVAAVDPGLRITHAGGDLYAQEIETTGNLGRGLLIVCTGTEGKGIEIDLTGSTNSNQGIEIAMGTSGASGLSITHANSAASGAGIIINMTGATGTMPAVDLNHAGAGIGLDVDMTLTTNATAGIDVAHAGSGNGITVSKSPATAKAGYGLGVVMGANATSAGVQISNSGVGESIYIEHGTSTAEGILLNTGGASTGLRISTGDAAAYGISVEDNEGSANPMISVTHTGTGSGVTVSQTDSGSGITVTKNPGSSKAGYGIGVTMGANTTGDGVHVAQSGSGYAGYFGGNLIVTGNTQLGDAGTDTLDVHPYWAKFHNYTAEALLGGLITIDEAGITTDDAVSANTVCATVRGKDASASDAGGALLLGGNATAGSNKGGWVMAFGGTGFGGGTGGNCLGFAGAGGATGTGGDAFLWSGAGGATSGNSGELSLTSGAVTNGTSGIAGLKTGDATTGASGNITIKTGAATTTSGNIDLDIGAGAATTGMINIGTSTAAEIVLGKSSNAASVIYPEGYIGSFLAFETTNTADSRGWMIYPELVTPGGSTYDGAHIHLIAGNVGTKAIKVLPPVAHVAPWNGGDVYVGGGWASNDSGGSGGGDGGNIEIYGGEGGSGGVGSAAGEGGSLTIYGGDAGAPGASGNDGGTVDIYGGSASGAGTEGWVAVAVTGAGKLYLGNTTGGIDINSYWGTFQNYTAHSYYLPAAMGGTLSLPSAGFQASAGLSGGNSTVMTLVGGDTATAGGKAGAAGIAGGNQTGTQGDGGPVLMVGGYGGTADTSNGGPGGSALVVGGPGGNAANVGAGGQGGQVLILGGTDGTGTAGLAAGRGGDVTLRAGEAGTAPGTGDRGGDINLRPGNKSGAGRNGELLCMSADGTSRLILLDTNFTIQAGTLLTTTGSGNINLPNNGSARFQIETVAVSADVTAANLGTLTAGPASDASALHTHAGLGVAAYTAGEALSQYDLVYAKWDGANQRVYKAIATAEATSRVVGMTTTAAGAGAAVSVTPVGQSKANFGAAPATTTFGQPVYLSDATAGQATLTAPSASGSVSVRIGYLVECNGALTSCKVQIFLGDTFVIT